MQRVKCGRFLLYLTISFVVTLVLYGKSVFYPFFFDDAVNLRLPLTYSIWQIWVTASGFAYYRPMAYFLWKIALLMYGRYPPVILHSLVILAHILNGSLLGLALDKSRGEGSDILFPISVVLLFSLFPFSYQDIAWVASFFHPLVLFCILGAVIGWLMYRQGDTRGLIIALIFSFLAPFAHESGVLVGPLVTLWVYFSAKEFDRRSVYLWASAPLFVFVWAVVPKTRDPATDLGLINSLRNLAYMLQGLFYPLFALFSGIHRPRGDWGYVLGVEGVGALLLIFALYHRREKRWMELGLSWFFVSIVPVILLLPFSYVIDGPRLLYVAGVGVSLFWGAFFLRHSWFSRGWRRGVGYLLLAGIMLFSANYVHHRMKFFDWGARLVWSAVQAAKATPPRGTVLFVNLPAWISDPDSPFKIGNDGATFIAEYAPFEDLLRFHGVTQRKVVAVTFPAAMQDVPYYHGFYGPTVSQDDLVHLIDHSDVVWFTRYTSSRGPELLWTGHVQPKEGEEEPLATFTQGWALLRGRIQAREKIPEVSVRLRWRCGVPLDDDWTIFLHLLDAQGRLLAQGDGHFFMNSYPPGRCSEGMVVEEMRYVPVSISQVRRVLVGLYYRPTLKRMPAFHRGKRWPQDAVVLPVDSAF